MGFQARDVGQCQHFRCVHLCLTFSCVPTTRRRSVRVSDHSILRQQRQEDLVRHGGGLGEIHHCGLLLDRDPWASLVAARQNRKARLAVPHRLAFRSAVTAQSCYCLHVKIQTALLEQFGGRCLEAAMAWHHGYRNTQRERDWIACMRCKQSQVQEQHIERCDLTPAITCCGECRCWECCKGQSAHRFGRQRYDPKLAAFAFKAGARTKPSSRWIVSTLKSLPAGTEPRCVKIPQRSEA